MLFCFCQLDTISDHMGRGKLRWKNVSVRLSNREVYESLFLIRVWCCKAQPTVNSDTCGQVVLGSVRKQDEQTLWLFTTLRFLRCFGTCLDFLWWWNMIWMRNSCKPFPLQIAFITILLIYIVIYILYVYVH